MKYPRSLLAALLIIFITTFGYYKDVLDDLIVTKVAYLKFQYNALNKASDKHSVLTTSSPVLTTSRKSFLTAGNIKKSLQSCPQVLSLGELAFLNRCKC